MPWGALRDRMSRAEARTRPSKKASGRIQQKRKPRRKR